jgi:hypothetical protein
VGNRRLACPTLLLLVVLGLAPSAWGWGCKGHQVVALVAEKQLSAHARAMVAAILEAGPINPWLRRFCSNSGLDAFADSSTWADDERTVRPDTAGWHFIDIPRGAPKGDIAQYCPSATGCVTGSIADQLAVLRNPGASAQARADALRYVIHFIGDLHQPLHATTNNDLGVNCIPVTFDGHDPQEANAQFATYRPNLHGIWDTDIIEDFTQGLTPEQVADELESKFQAQIAAWKSQAIDLSAWAWESHQIAEDTVYGLLPVKVPIETPRETPSCADDDRVSNRMLALHEKLDNAYAAAAEATIREQLAEAGVRLASALNSIWP